MGLRALADFWRCAAIAAATGMTLLGGFGVLLQWGSPFLAGSATAMLLLALVATESGLSGRQGLVDFTTMAGTERFRLARLNPDGSVDPSFTVGSGVDGTVSAFAIQPDGRILIGGFFTGTLQDPALRSQVEEACLAIDVDTHVLPVTQFRDDIKQVRDRAHQGGVTLIADRAFVRNASDTTVVLSLETLQRVITGVVERSAEAYKRRSTPADFLIGIQPVSPTASTFELDFDSVARQEANSPSTSSARHRPARTSKPSGTAPNDSSTDSSAPARSWTSPRRSPTRGAPSSTSP